jgi:hypothetical protein
MNSVSPSTTPRMIALRKSKVMDELRRGERHGHVPIRKGLAASFVSLVT